MYEEKAENMLLDSFKKSTYQLKETKEGAEKMGEIQQLIYNQGDAHGFMRGKTEGLIQGAVKMVNRMIKLNIPIEEIKKDLNEDYSPEVVKEVLSQTNLLETWSEFKFLYLSTKLG